MNHDEVQLILAQAGVIGLDAALEVQERQELQVVPVGGARGFHGRTTIFPVRVPALCKVFSSCKRWAAAASASGKVLPISARSFFAECQRLMSSAQARCSSGVALNMAKPNNDKSRV